MNTATILRPLGPFDLGAAHRFACAAAQLCIARPDVDGGHVHLAFVSDGERLDAVGACVQPGDVPGTVTVDLYGDVHDEARVLDQVTRILSIDVDATDWPAVAERDPVVGRLIAARPGFRPTNFVSPYECACWLLLTHRSSMAQASAVRDAIAADLGGTVDIHGDVRRVFPGPAALRDLGAIRGLADVKAGRLRAVAEAALHCDLLDGARLRSVPAEEAIDQLITALPGVGPFTAQGILLRGAGAPDVLAPAEPRLVAAVERAYGLGALPDRDELARIAEPWRPFRSWVQVLLRVGE